MLHVEYLCLRPRLYGANLSRVEESPSSRVKIRERSCEIKNDPFAQANGARVCSDYLNPDQANPAGRSKMFVWRKIGSSRRVTLPSQKADLGRYYSARFVVKELYEKLARPG